jgi:parvulin-like peptidyl-prolyl isomerase
MLPGVVAAKRGQSFRMSGRQRFALILFGAILALLFIGFAVAQGIGAPSVSSGAVATVQDVPDEIANVSQEDFDQALEQQVAQAKLKKAPAPGSKKYEEMKEAALGEQLDQIWIEGEAEELGITVTDKQVEAELESIKKQNFPTPAAYKKFLKESHFTQENVDDRVKLQLLSTQIQETVNAETPAPSSSEIQAYYEAEKAAQFTTKESRDVRLIINKDKKKIEEAKALLEKDSSPANWKKVAPKFASEPAAAKEGGLQKGITEEALGGNRPIQKAIFGSATGELVGPVKFEENWLLVEVVKLSPAKTQSLAEAKAQISETLSQGRQQEFFAEFVSGYQTKWRERTVCASDYAIEKCSNFTGDGHPASASPACYEADPKTPAKECPAPVTANSPALPGSVTEQKPKGEPFPQRSLPEASPEQGKEVPTEAPTGAPPSGE